MINFLIITLSVAISSYTVIAFAPFLIDNYYWWAFVMYGTAIGVLIGCLVKPEKIGAAFLGLFLCMIISQQQFTDELSQSQDNNIRLVVMLFLAYGSGLALFPRMRLFLKKRAKEAEEAQNQNPRQ